MDDDGGALLVWLRQSVQTGITNAICGIEDEWGLAPHRLWICTV